MTRSNRCYALVTTEVREGESSVKNEGVKIAASKKKDKKPINEIPPDDEIPPDGHGSIKALHIITKVKYCTLPKVLIDNGSSLNVMPLSTLMRLLVDRSYMMHSKTVVRAFDGTR